MAGIQNNVLYSSGDRLLTSSTIDISQMQTLTTDVARINHVGDPTGVITANPSSLCHDPVSGDVYIKTTGTDSNGWDAVFGELSAPPIGSLAYFSNFNGDSYVTSAGWLKCNGQIVSQATYSTLFSRIGLINNGGTQWTIGSVNTTSVINALIYTSKFVLGSLSASGTFISPAVQTSTDGISWTSAASGAIGAVTSLAYSGSLYVAATSSGWIGTSTDALTWNTRSPSFPVLIYTTFFVATSGGNISPGIYTSTDAITWTSRTYISTSTLNTLTFGNSQYIATGAAGALFTSSNAITWTSQTTGTSNIMCSAYGNLLYLIGGNTGYLATSTNGVSWSTQVTGTTSIIQAISYGNSAYVYGCPGGRIASSTDAVTWTSRTSNTTSNIQALAYLNTLFIYCAGSGGIGTSTDATTWTARTSNTTSALTCLTYGTVYVAAGLVGAIVSSTDAITWTARTSGVSSNITSLAYNGSHYVATGNNFILTSTDATTWTTQTTYVTVSSINGAAFGNSTYAIATSGGGIFTSTDANTWTSRVSGTASSIRALSYLNSLFVYCGDGGVLATSTDAITWTARTSGSTSTLWSLDYNGVYLLGGSSGYLASSTDAITWVPLTSNTPGNIYSLSHAGSIGIGVCSGGLIITSTNNTLWNQQTSQTTSDLKAVTYGANLFLAAGGNAASSAVIERSATTYTYNTSTQFQIPQDANLGITQELTTNFMRNLYIKAILP